MMAKAIYQVEIEENDIDASGEIIQILEQYLTNKQNKVTANLMRVEE
jgi:hypothetical protein